MTDIEKACFHALSELVKMEAHYTCNPASFGKFLTEIVGLERDYIKEITKIMIDSILIGKPLGKDFLCGIIFHQLVLKCKQIAELEQWNAEKN